MHVSANLLSVVSSLVACLISSSDIAFGIEWVAMKFMYHSADCLSMCDASGLGCHDKKLDGLC